MNWHKRLTQAREAKKLNKSAFAKLVGVSPPSVTDWENGDTKMIDGMNLVRVCNALNISPAWLMGIDVTPSAPEAVEASQATTQGDLSEVISLIGFFAKLSPRGRKFVLDSASGMASGDTGIPGTQGIAADNQTK